MEAVLLGLVGAAAAFLFDFLLAGAGFFFLETIGGYSPTAIATGRLPQPSGWIVVATTLGGLLTGLLVFTFAPEAEGHGTDSAVKSFHQEEGVIRARVPLVKTIASAITIGSGGSAGREGPIALIAAGIGSVYAQMTGRPPTEKRLLLLAGMAAGLSAIFRSPIGAAIFAVEVLYSKMELEARALTYCLISSVVGYLMAVGFSSPEPIFVVGSAPPPGAQEYLAYLLLGLLAGVLANFLPLVFYGVRDLFRRLPLPAQWKPSLGGFFVGLIALQFPQVLGGGYGTIRQALADNLSLTLLLSLIVVKVIALSFTVSSGGSGGVFAPTLFVGAMLGGAVSQVSGFTAEPLVILGMGAVFGAAARVPISTIFMVTELTSDYDLLAPAALTILLAFLVQTRLSVKSPYPSLYEAQVPYREDSPAWRGREGA